jgi:hypothetical protein
MDPNPNQVKDEKTFQRDFKNLDLGDWRDPTQVISPLTHTYAHNWNQDKHPHQHGLKHKDLKLTPYINGERRGGRGNKLGILIFTLAFSADCYANS